VKSSIASLAESAKKYQSNPSDKHNLQLVYTSYVHAAHYYLIIEGLKRKSDVTSISTPFLGLIRDPAGPTSQNLHHLGELCQTLIV
jgi:hypothetical protein